ncbi:electron transport complex subunit RsxC [Colwellia psychrerythraea]|uniref:Ion-translocating oxidoreductase complex subunit C n=1 Tax=Colwellia psychrerythraea TaxID=28229 RepID=A0A099KBT9_COLPS|nr:electron transport complex subunit RsxC [Colwellia psychrerythraea]KGJ87790.1 Electron transport complex protein rnfC [Colwellia psychrerythraea]
MVESVIERITRGHFWDFHGGIHPPEQKFLTASKPIKQLALPKQLIIPLQQHIGREGDLLVSIGDHVLKGQALTLSTNLMVVPIHAPTSGTISAIKTSIIAHPSGFSQLCIFLDVDGEDTWRKRKVCPDLEQLSNHEIIKKIADAGIAGMGGAGFPTHIKVNSKPDINFLIINGAECEPYITADDLLMMEQSDAIVDGIKILDKLLSPAFILIAIEDNKPKAIKALQQATAGIEKIKVCVVPTKYPAGGEKQLIQILTGKEVTSGQLPIHAGIVMQNVATCFAINEAVRHDTPLIRRVVTVTGQALDKPQNVWALLGTPVNFLLEKCAVQALENEKQPVIMGGPMMGFSIASELVPIVKTSNCILVPSKTEMPSAFEKESNEVECIRCGQCSDVCPSQLLPQELQWSAKAKDYPQLEKLNLSDCIDCGACAYVCPSQIPLVHYYRIAKAEIRQQQQLDLKAEKAKIRFEARKLRLEKEKMARQEKHKKAAAARKAAMNKATPEATGAKSAVAAALARVKAKKAASKSGSIDSQNKPVDAVVDEPVNEQKSQVAAAIARAKAKKKLKQEAALQAPKSDVLDKENPAAVVAEQPAQAEKSSVDDKKTKIAAAIAKAKAKKLNAASQSIVPIAPPITAAADKVAVESSLPEDISPKGIRSEKTSAEKPANTDDKKTKIAAAIAKAKSKALAKKSAQASSLSASAIVEESVIVKVPVTEEETMDSSAAPDAVNQSAEGESKSGAADKKAKISAAIAKAKAKKKLKESNKVDSNVTNKD